MTKDAPLRALSSTPIPRIGLGCMGMSEFYGSTDDDLATRSLEAAIAIGYRHFDTADFYGAGHNEELVGRFLCTLPNRVRDDLVIATKAGIRRGSGTPPSLCIDSSPAHVLAACDQSLRRLGIERIDLYYLHRRSPEIPIEDTMGAMADLVRAGKIRLVGLSEVATDTLRRAHAVHPVTAIQSEYSLWTRDPEDALLDECRALGVTFVAYAPLGRGFLTGTLTRQKVSGPGDLRAHLPRFSESNFAVNERLLSGLASVAESVGATLAQVAIAWVLARAPHIHVIPGARKSAHIEANFAAGALRLTADQVEFLSRHFDTVAGARYPEALLKTVGV